MLLHWLLLPLHARAHNKPSTQPCYRKGKQRWSCGDGLDQKALTLSGLVAVESTGTDIYRQRLAGVWV